MLSCLQHSIVYSKWLQHSILYSRLLYSKFTQWEVLLWIIRLGACRFKSLYADLRTYTILPPRRNVRITPASAAAARFAPACARARLRVRVRACARES